MRVAHVIESKPTFYTQPVVVCRAVATLNRNDFVLVNLVGDLATHTTIRTDAFNFCRGNIAIDAFAVDHRGLNQGACRTGLYAFATSNAGTVTHRVIKIKHNLRVNSPIGHADDIIDLNFPTCAYTQITVNACVQINTHRRVASVGFRAAAFGNSPHLWLQLVGPLPKSRFRIMGRFSGGLIRGKHLEYQFAREPRTLAVGIHLHSRLRFSNTGSRQHPFAFNFDHAGPAVAIRAVARFGRIAKMRQLIVVSIGNLPNRFVRGGLDLDTVQMNRKIYAVAHVKSSLKYFMTDSNGLAAA